MLRLLDYTWFVRMRFEAFQFLETPSVGLLHHMPSKLKKLSQGYCTSWIVYSFVRNRHFLAYCSTLSSVEAQPVSSQSPSGLMKLRQHDIVMQIEAAGRSFDYRNVKQGDCVVAFSRRAIYEVKAAIEKCTGLRYHPMPAPAILKTLGFQEKFVEAP